jgi:predicted SprT family Zn-dependent metalloprotease
MHLGYKVKVEWEIKGLEWKRLMKQFNSTKDKYSHLFYATTILTNFLCKCFLDFT